MRSHGKWGDFLVALIPLSWCGNILINSNFILRMLEWQNESSLFTVRIQGKQWYWSYKYSSDTNYRLNNVYINVGHNNWQKNANQSNLVFNSSNSILTFIYDYEFKKIHKQNLEKYSVDRLTLNSSNFYNNTGSYNVKQNVNKNNNILNVILNKYKIIKISKTTALSTYKYSFLKTLYTLPKYHYTMPLQENSKLVLQFNKPFANLFNLQEKYNELSKINFNKINTYTKLKTAKLDYFKFITNLKLFKNFFDINTVYKNLNFMSKNNFAKLNIKDLFLLENLRKRHKLVLRGVIKWDSNSNLFLSKKQNFHLFENDRLDEVFETSENLRLKNSKFPVRLNKGILSKNNIALLQKNSYLGKNIFFNYKMNKTDSTEKISQPEQFWGFRQKRYKKMKSFAFLQTPKYNSTTYSYMNNFLYENKLNTYNAYTSIKNNKYKNELIPVSLARRLLRTKRTLVLPAHINLTLITNSYDVVHSWFVPGLGLKIDCVPGRSTHHSLYIDNVGFYYGQCAEICGRYHHHMPIRVCALPFEHFMLWWQTKGLPRMYRTDVLLKNKNILLNKFKY